MNPKTRALPLTLLLALTACSAPDATEGETTATEGIAMEERVEVDATPTLEGDRYGAAITLDRITPVAHILAAPASYLGQTVLVEGRVGEVCEHSGCWMDVVADDGVDIRVKVEDGVIVFPLSARGRTALVEGKVEALELTPAETFARAANRARAAGEPFDSSATYPASTVYRIRGTGALIRG